MEEYEMPDQSLEELYRLQDQVSELKSEMGDIKMLISQYHDPIDLPNGYGFLIKHQADLGDLLISVLICILISLFLLKYFTDLIKRR